MSIDRKLPQTIIPQGPIPILARRLQEMPPLPESDDPVLFGILPPASFDAIVEDTYTYPLYIFNIL